MKKFFWVDMEMTGLDEKTHVIIEVAAAVTDMNLNILAEYESPVYQPEEEMAKMDDWCVKTHGESGLTERVKTGKPLADVEKDVLGFLNLHFPTKDRIPLAGNSIGNDKRFIDKYMPALSQKLHYRVIDVSSFKEVFRTKYGINVDKAKRHRALDDIRESIMELKTYLRHVSIQKD